jgi:hypothetical protein
MRDLTMWHVQVPNRIFVSTWIAIIFMYSGCFVNGCIRLYCMTCSWVET